jgi:hypothetical protein
LGVFRHRDETRPVLLAWKPKDLDDFHHLVALERNRLFTVHLGLFAFEDWAEREKLGEDASHSPHIDGRRIMSTSKEKLWGSIPDRNDYLVSRKKRVKGFIEEAGES